MFQNQWYFYYNFKLQKYFSIKNIQKLKQTFFKLQKCFSIRINQTEHIKKSIKLFKIGSTFYEKMYFLKKPFQIVGFMIVFLFLNKKLIFNGVPIQCFWTLAFSGMKKESILSEEEKMQKWQKIKDNRAKKQTGKRDRTTGKLKRSEKHLK